MSVVIHKDAVLGSGVQVGPMVVVGGDGKRVGLSVIGNNVMIGAGAKVLGPVRIADGAKIGANAVVMCDGHANHTAVVVPAHVLPPRRTVVS